MDFSPWSPSDTAADMPPPWLDAIDIPHQLDTLPDGTETVVIGDVQCLADHTHLQGDNVFGFEGTCGLCSCQDVLGQFGLNVSENDMVLHAVENAQCLVSDNPLEAGGTSAQTQAELLSDYGIPAHVDYAGSLEDLAAGVEQDRGVIIEANAGVLWDDDAYLGDGGRNHAVTVTGVARSPLTGEIHGFYINDTGPGVAARFVDAAAMELAWLDTGGEFITTDVTRAGAAAFAGGNL
jgi:hypothetical protein